VVETIFPIATNASFPLLGILGGFADVIIGAITELLKVLFSPIMGVIEDNVAALTEAIVQTPHPDAVFGAPTTARGRRSMVTTGRRSSRCRSACTGWPSGW